MIFEIVDELKDLEFNISNGFEVGFSMYGALNLNYTSLDGQFIQSYCILATDSGIMLREGVHPYPTAQIYFNQTQLNSFKRGTLALRDPKVCASLNLRGDLAFVQELITCCSKPDSETLEAIEESQRLSKKLQNIEATYLKSPNKAEFFDMLSSMRPHVFSDLIDWPAMSWTFNDVKIKYGNEVFRPGPDGGEKLGRLIDLLYEKNDVYSHGCAVPDVMRHEFKFPYIEEEDLSPMQLWIGTKCEEPVTGLHRDTRPVFLAQIIGRKKVILYPPHEAPYLYPRKAHNNFYQGCWLDPSKPNFDKFPLFGKANSIEIVLNPGDIAYIPLGWFHYVYALDDVLSVSTIVSNLSNRSFQNVDT